METFPYAYIARFIEAGGTVEQFTRIVEKMTGATPGDDDSSLDQGGDGPNEAGQVLVEMLTLMRDRD